MSFFLRRLLRRFVFAFFCMPFFFFYCFSLAFTHLAFYHLENESELFRDDGKGDDDDDDDDGKVTHRYDIIIIISYSIIDNNIVHTLIKLIDAECAIIVDEYASHRWSHNLRGHRRLRRGKILTSR
jgi:hypothetical protein